MLTYYSINILVSMLNGIILLCFITYKFDKKTILQGILTGLFSLYIWSLNLNPEFIKILRMTLWFSSIYYRLNKVKFPIKLSRYFKIFHIVYFLFLKMIFEISFFYIQNEYNLIYMEAYNNFMSVMFSWLPFIGICMNYNLKNIKLFAFDAKYKNINFVKLLTLFLTLLIFLVGYFIILEFKRGV